MTPGERRASLSLASIFALRMLGLFLVLPVFALEAGRYPGGDDPARVGLAMGIYGLTQALLQIPLGLASDRWGRKPVILAGLALFAAGSAIAAWAPTLDTLILGRAMQGAGAISAAITAFVADVTRDEVRTKAMALVGISIALMFALSLVFAPILAAQIGLSGLFAVTTALALVGMAVVVWVVPPEPAEQRDAGRAGLREVLRHTGLLRLDLGVFVLHAVQLAMWVAVPTLLVQAGLEAPRHWIVYLLALVGSFMVMGGVLFRLERLGYMRAVFPGRHRPDPAGAAGVLVERGQRRTLAHLAGHRAVPVLSGLQHTGGQPAQPGVAAGPGPRPGRGAGGLQHAAVGRVFCRWCRRWLAHGAVRAARPVHGLCGPESAVAGGGVADAGSAPAGACTGSKRPSMNSAMVAYSGRLIMRDTRLASRAQAIRLSTMLCPSVISMTMIIAVIGACVTAARKPAMPMAISA
jgi:MFS family permease